MNVYQIMTERILELLKKGTVPWHKPWKPEAGMPRNLLTKKPYRGVNVFLLIASNYASPYWLTYKQAQDLGGHVKKGEKGTPIVFWKVAHVSPAAAEAIIEEETPAGEDKPIPVLRYYTVFNLSQTAGIPAPPEEAGPRAFNPIAECERILAGMPHPPTIQHGRGRAVYRPLFDAVEMPSRERFHTEEEYYSTLFHELGHATGHAKRLGRRSLADLCPFGSTNYSREELVAEMTATFLCGVAGIGNATVQNSAAYIAGWQRALANDPRAVVIAAAQAQKAADWILGKHQAEEAVRIAG